MGRFESKDGRCGGKEPTDLTLRGLKVEVNVGLRTRAASVLVAHLCLAEDDYNERNSCSIQSLGIYSWQKKLKGLVSLS